MPGGKTDPAGHQHSISMSQSSLLGTVMQDVKFYTSKFQVVATKSLFEIMS